MGHVLFSHKLLGTFIAAVVFLKKSILALILHRGLLTYIYVYVIRMNVYMYRRTTAGGQASAMASMDGSRPHMSSPCMQAKVMNIFFTSTCIQICLCLVFLMGFCDTKTP